MVAVADDPRFRRFFEGMQHADVKSINADISLRHFIAGMLSYHPWWMAMLFRVRGILVNLLGLVRHDLPDRSAVLSPEAISFVPGDKALFFIVREAEENRFWVAESPPDKHLTAYIGVVAQGLDDGMTRFSVFTTVRYLHWTGPVYFNLIRPFHHLVVARMMAAAKTASPLLKSRRS
jgi:hypothetical protein